MARKVIVNGLIYTENDSRQVIVGSGIYHESSSGAAPGVSFDGPNIIAQSGVQNDPFSFDDNLEGTVASRFTGATSYAYAPGSDQPAGITINATTGNPEGTPSVSGTFDITIEGSD